MCIYIYIAAGGLHHQAPGQDDGAGAAGARAHLAPRPDNNQQ